MRVAVLMSAETLFDGLRFRVERICEVAGDRPRYRDVVRHPGAAVVLPLVDTDHVCLIRNFRVAVGQTLIELPAGTLEPGEAPAETAQRELREETGYRAQSWTPLHTFYPSPGILDERMVLFLAQNLTAGEAAREDGEQIENLVASWSECDRLIRDGSICDAKTLVGLLLGRQWLAQS